MLPLKKFPASFSDADKKKRVQMLKNIGKVAFKRVPPKIESALRLHSDELTDLANEFRLIDICDIKSLQIYSFYEQRDTELLGDLVRDSLITAVCLVNGFKLTFLGR